MYQTWKVAQYKSILVHPEQLMIYDHFINPNLYIRKKLIVSLFMVKIDFTPFQINIGL